uniref:Secreted protein n=1 Tax=Mesocestoides corti TaxID=53468 RepID=A0A5K3F6B9_MESCO
VPHPATRRPGGGNSGGHQRCFHSRQWGRPASWSFGETTTSLVLPTLLAPSLKTVAARVTSWWVLPHPKALRARPCSATAILLLLPTLLAHFSTVDTLHTTMEIMRQGVAIDVSDNDVDDHDGLRHLSSMSLDEGRAPPRPADASPIS